MIGTSPKMQQIYRLARLDLPPLRDRAEGIVPLASHFLAVFCRQADVPQKLFTEEPIHLLQKHFWPGHVRELQHLIERAFILSESSERIQPEGLEMPSRST